MSLNTMKNIKKIKSQMTKTENKISINVKRDFFQKNSITLALISSGFLTFAPTGIFAQELSKVAIKDSVVDNSQPLIAQKINETDFNFKKTSLSDLGRIWLTEDPSLLQPHLTIATVDKIAFDQVKSEVLEKIDFSIYTNYSAFIKKAVIYVYAPNDFDRIKPIAQLEVPIKGLVNQINFNWNGDELKILKLSDNDRLQFVLRVYDSHNRWDETKPAYLDLVTPSDKAKSLEALRNVSDLGIQLQSKEVGLSLDEYWLKNSTFGNSTLAIQNIPLLGSKVKVRGHDIKENLQISINDQVLPIDSQRRFLAEYLLPIGQFSFDIKSKSTSDNKFNLNETLNTNVTGEYFVMVALADINYSKNSYNGQIEAVTEDDFKRFNGSQTDARLAFYLKGKIKGKYLLTAQADTQEKNAKDLLKGFFKADRIDLFRKIDPELYYPVYADQSTSTNDVDTSGRLYIRLDWDKSSVTFGNVKTELNSQNLSTYNRSLYGAKLNFKSLDTNPYGEAITQVKTFFAEQQTSPGRAEFLGTGGSLYYLPHTDIVPSSAQVTLELRDKLSSRVVSSYELKVGRDYEIDEFQGRIILSRPLLQITKDNNPIQEDVIDGHNNILVTQYEYYPKQFDSNNMSAGWEVKQWINNKLALGANYVKENRTGQDYELAGAQVTVQEGVGTWFTAELAQSKSTSAPYFFSNDGGLRFNEITTVNTNLLNQGNAYSLEARVNSQELGWTNLPIKMAAWAKQKDANFSSNYSVSNGKKQDEVGAELLGILHPNFQILGSIKHLNNSQVLAVNDQSFETLDKSTIGSIWKYNSSTTVSSQIEHVLLKSKTNSKSTLNQGEANLAGLRIDKKVNPEFDVYLGLQKSFAEKDYAENDAATVGAKYDFSNDFSISLDYTEADRGSSLNTSAEYKRTPDHTIYGSYVYSPRTSDYSGLTESLISSKTFTQQQGISLGQRIQLTDKLRASTESQILNDQNSKAYINSVGLDLMPKQNWQFGVSYQKGKIYSNTGNSSSDLVDSFTVNNQPKIQRQTVSFSGSYIDEKIEWTSKIEQRVDSTETKLNEKSEQLLNTNRINYRLSNDLVFNSKLNYSLTESKNSLENSQQAKLIDSGVGFAWSPVNERWNLLSKYSYFYDLAPLGQVSSNGSEYDQKSHILSIEGTYILNKNWELGAKIAKRQTAIRLERGVGDWFTNNATYAAAQLRFKISRPLSLDTVQSPSELESLTTGWSVLTEYRSLKTEKDGVKSGFLIGVDKELTKNLRLGVGYNFTNFSADLTQLSYRSKGYFINLVSKF